MRVDAAEGVVSEDARTWISELEKRSVIGIPLLCWKLCWLSGQFAGVFLQNELPNILLSGIKSIQIFQMIEHFIHDGLHSFCFCIRFKIIQFQTMYVIQYFENLYSCHHCRNFYLASDITFYYFTAFCSKGFLCHYVNNFVLEGWSPTTFCRGRFFNMFLDNWYV